MTKEIKFEQNYINNKLQNIVNDDLISFHMPGHKKGKIMINWDMEN